MPLISSRDIDKSKKIDEKLDSKNFVFQTENNQKSAVNLFKIHKFAISLKQNEKIFHSFIKTLSKNPFYKESLL